MLVKHETFHALPKLANKKREKFKSFKENEPLPPKKNKKKEKQQ
jgi:hypothetical protein